MDWAKARDRALAWQRSGLKVVLTNGCFDLLHPGHVQLLDRARREGDRLMVAINSDASVRCLKGPSRPVVGEGARARVLAGLEAVDAVVIFNEPTPLQLIERLRPEVLVKGGDYAGEEIVGGPEVRSWGGRVVFVPFLEGFSTTELIARARPGKG
ncbi:MAG TPA: D-glycero-beta-D-manno-heptose 1-phosphate adenylyltransferase [Acidobacteriaceae bacterium]|jgi:D-beta-D-heptose 7-phosphate kinase/D-beta-D-heptose 1-phosphate adenosyltransferase|nr:D-glycero-beta-D-manno-heptose 1-phosphate adenylyltransferase [Acidobacteriaceae bacterium]